MPGPKICYAPVSWHAPYHSIPGTRHPGSGTRHDSRVPDIVPDEEVDVKYDVSGLPEVPVCGWGKGEHTKETNAFNTECILRIRH